MGINNIRELKPFTEEDIKNKNLILSMLQFEDQIGKSDEIGKMFQIDSYMGRTSLNVIHAIHRMTLDHFDFDTSNKSVENYRKIFLHYYNSPTDYDEDVINSVYYMKNNKCVFYTQPELKVGMKLKNCSLYESNGITKKMLFDILENDFSYAFLCAFSNS